MLTDVSPFLRVIKISGNDQGEVFIAHDKTIEWKFGDLMGGTPLLSSQDNDDWLYGFVYSFKVDDGGFRKQYYYTVLRFHHRDKRLEYYPLPIEYNDEGLDAEYLSLWQHSNGKHHKGVIPAGITTHDDGVIVSFGKDDVSSYTEYFSWSRIRSYFN